MILTPRKLFSDVKQVCRALSIDHELEDGENSQEEEDEMSSGALPCTKDTLPRSFYISRIKELGQFFAPWNHSRHFVGVCRDVLGMEVPSVTLDKDRDGQDAAEDQDQSQDVDRGKALERDNTNVSFVFKSFEIN